MSDLDLRQRVLDQLAFEPGIDAAAIGVTATRDGVVTLTGHVPSYAQRALAESAVWRVKGVKALAEELIVRLPQDKRRADDEIAERAVRILEWSDVVPPDAVRIKVCNGWVTLTGKVDWYFQRLAAEQSVRKLSGVVGVSNELEITPALVSGDVRERIVAALRRTAEDEARRIRIDVHGGGRVTIDGEVSSWDEREAVTHAVWSTPGVTQVEDRIRIV